MIEQVKQQPLHTSETTMCFKNVNGTKQKSAHARAVTPLVDIQCPMLQDLQEGFGGFNELGCDNAKCLLTQQNNIRCKKVIAC